MSQIAKQEKTFIIILLIMIIPSGWAWNRKKHRTFLKIGTVHDFLEKVPKCSLLRSERFLVFVPGIMVWWQVSLIACWTPCTTLQRQTAVTYYFSGKQLLLLAWGQSTTGLAPRPCNPVLAFTQNTEGNGQQFCHLNPLKHDSTIVIFSHYKPRLAAVIILTF